MGEHIYRNSEKFTPGPWFYEKDLVTIFSEEGDVCDLVTNYNEKQMPFEANGALISSAPELYNTLKNILNALNGEFFPVDFIEDGKVFAINAELYEAMIQACKVLKKARGETMLCYKDMTFCTAIDCVNLECKRNMNREDFTPDSFWKDKIAQSDFRKICKQYYKTNISKKENKNEESGHDEVD